MAIAFTKYVDIVSGVGGVGGVSQRELIGRIYTSNALVPTGGALEFTELLEVAEFFGTASEEYQRASFYFGFVSKNITQADKISFSFFSGLATAPLIYGGTEGKAVSDYTGISDGQLLLTMGAVTVELTALDFTTAASLSDVATVMQTAVQAGDASALWSGATVTYDAVRGSFNLVGGDTGEAVISTAPATGGTDMRSLLGWVDSGIITSTGALFSDGIDAATPVEALTTSVDQSNNFGSFLFQPSLTLPEIETIAEWTDAQNVRFIYCVPVDSATAATYYAALQNNGGTAVTLSETANEYPEMVPMILLASTKYSQPNSVQNYMYQVFDLTPSVTTTTDSNTYDGIRINYYGQTQNAGQFVEFYQRGKLMGQSTDPIPMNVYANEIWLKDAMGVALLNLLLALPTLPANKKGRASVMTTCQSVINRALGDGKGNGTISIGKVLNDTQKAYIGTLTADSLAWRQVSTLGYWLDAYIQEFDNAGTTDYKAVYKLVYAKDDAILKVEGSHILI